MLVSENDINIIEALLSYVTLQRWFSGSNLLKQNVLLNLRAAKPCGWFYVVYEKTVTDKNQTLVHANLHVQFSFSEIEQLTKGGIPDSIPCTQFLEPQHGTMRCGSRLCMVECHPGYKMSRDTAFVYVCSDHDGTWSTIPKGKPVPWPDCKVGTILSCTRISSW